MATRQDTLQHAEGGLTSDAAPGLRPRVSVLLGPGATFDGIAGLLLPLFAPTPPSFDDLARALIMYNSRYLPGADWRHHRVGLRLPLPVEIDPTGWIVDSAAIGRLAQGFPPTWEARRSTPPTTLDLPDPFALPTEANALVAANPDPALLSDELWTRAIRNPYADVFLIPAVFRRLAGTDPGTTALAMVETSVDHQLQLLAGTSTGNAILRLLATVLAPALPTLDQPSLATARSRLEAALHTGPATARALVPHRELPETAAQLKSRGRVHIHANAEPTGDLHRLVLGRDVAVGTVDSWHDDDGTTYRGPEFEGRLAVGPLTTAHAALVNPTNDARVAARIEIIAAIAPNEANLDGARARDSDLIASGVHQWGAQQANELPSLLARFKRLAGDEFDLLFALHGLDVQPDPHRGTDFQLLRIEPAGPPTVLTGNDRFTFFGGSGTIGHTITFTSDWVARFRLAALVSATYLRAEIEEAAARFDRIRTEVGSIHIGGTPGSTVPLPDLISSKQGAALILDSHINRPGRVGSRLRAAARPPLDTDADKRDRTITTRYHDERSVVQKRDRNQRIDAQHLDQAHGSFTGW